MTPQLIYFNSLTQYSLICLNVLFFYVYQQDKFYDTSYDTGDKYIQCGRRADVLKFWTMWKAKVRSYKF